MQKTELFSLDNFEGPLDFLLYLVQKNEINLYEISIEKITTQIVSRLKEEIQNSLDQGAEFIGIVSTLLWLKSKMLLPKKEQSQDSLVEEGVDPRFEIIHQLIEYCRFKDAARLLIEKEKEQEIIFSRDPMPLPDRAPVLGVEHLTLSDLLGLFKQALSRAAARPQLIQEEVWRISDKIDFIKESLAQFSHILFFDIFHYEKSREELIVTFLAVLELMKVNEINVVRQSEQIIITKWQENG